MKAFSILWKMIVVISTVLTAWKLSVDYLQNNLQQSVLTAIINPYAALTLSLVQNQSLLQLIVVLVAFLVIIFLLLIFTINKTLMWKEQR